MQVIEEKLHAIHAEARRSRSSDDAVGSDGMETDVVRGFLVVTEVTASSPAAAAVCVCVCVCVCVHVYVSPPVKRGLLSWLLCMNSKGFLYTC